MSEAIHDAQRLAELQALPLERKIQITQARILEWDKHYNGKIVVSFSGGKDSTVLLDLVRRALPDTKAVFSNTGLEYKEIQQFVYQTPNADVIRPKLRFDEVISTYGYPLIGKEVAEAIYYARKIRSQSVQVERERERERESRTSGRKRAEMAGERTNGDGWSERFSKPADSLWDEASGLEKAGNRGGQTSRLIQTSSARNRRTVLCGQMQGSGRAGVAAGQSTGEGTFQEKTDKSSCEKQKPG